MKSLLSPLLILALSALGVTVINSSAEAKKVEIKLGTVAPEGSAWHNAISRLAQRWKEASNGEVTLKIYPGGVAGDEGDMIRKINIGQLHAAMITGIGLGRIHRAAVALQIPMLIESWPQLDYVRDKISPKIEKELETKGFVVLNWGDAGWVHQFSKTSAMTPDDFRKLKMSVWNGDPESERAWRAAKFNVVPLSVTDVMSGLQTGMVEAFGTTSLYALTSQWYTVAKNMVKVNWAPLSGATVISKAQWEKIEPGIRDKLMAIAREEGQKLRDEIRTLDDKSIQAMVAHGLKVAVPDVATVEAWRKAAAQAYPEIRGKVVPDTYFDEVARLAQEYSANNKSSM